ncbi:MAG: hypothetical protein DME26_16680 [Verrucomicrobia bacterium]|nr:MAG: hypothetical protein DME26_16680 [Verrucomicrobiota bacterium]
MNISTSPPGNVRSSRRSRFLRRSAFVAAVLLTLIASFYTIENWRGRRAWEQYQRELKAKGERLNWAAYVPARVPDEQNFIKTPLLEAVGYRPQLATNAWRPLEDARQCLVWEAWVDAHAGRKMDWAQCQAALRRRTDLNLPPLPQTPATDLLQALQGIEPQLDELRAASLKPFAQFDIDRTAPFEESRDFNFIAVRTMSQLFAYHACAELALDQSDKAFADVRVIHRFSDSLKNENTLVTLMIRVALQGLALEPFWQGWAEGRWTERDLAGFQELFGRVDLLPEFTRVMHAERAGITALVEKYGIRGNEFWRVTMRSEPVSKGWWGVTREQTRKMGWELVPRGWIYQNLVSYNHRIQAFLPSSLQSKLPTVSPAQVDEIRERLPREIPSGPYGWLSQMAIPNFARALEALAKNQTFVNQARIVCALEGYRKARGQYPESLAER